MSGAIDISGTMTIPGDACGDCSGVGDSITKALGADCAKTYSTVVATGRPLTISTAGAIGAEFVDLDLLDDLSRIEFLFLRSSSDLRVRIGAQEARLDGVGGTFPTGFAGGQTLLVTIDGVPLTVTFDAADQTAAQVAARINAAAALAGLATPRATVLSSGQLRISGILTGDAGTVAITGGTGAATLGLTGSAVGDGEDIPLSGQLLAEFSRNDTAPARIQVSGQASLTVVAGGRSD